MLFLVIILVVLCLLLAGYIGALNLEVKRMSEILKTISTSQTNGEVYTLTSNRQFQQLARRINIMLMNQRRRERRLKKADEAFKESVTGISHDLRTPLTSVSGYLQMIRSDKTPVEKKIEYFHIIEGRLAALLSLLDELFEYTRLELEQPVLQQEKLNLGAVLAEQLALYYQEFTDKGITPQIEIPEKPVTVFCDKASLERILQNLIKNALVHGEGGLWVTLECREGFAAVGFANNAGQSTADPERLFDRFYTADKSRSGKSTGLGLSIVRQLTERMGGLVEAQKQADMLTITVSFPCV